MALQKSKELASGVSGEYWKATDIFLGSGFTTCKAVLYKDAVTRTAGKSQVYEEVFMWSGDANPCTIAAMNVADSNPIKLCYAKLKTLDEFSGAQDI